MRVWLVDYSDGVTMSPSQVWHPAGSQGGALAVVMEDRSRYQDKDVYVSVDDEDSWWMSDDLLTVRGWW